MPSTTSGNIPIAVCSWSLQPSSPAALIASLDRLGIRRVQLALSPVIHQPDRWGEAIAQLRRAGVDIVSGMMETTGEDYSTLKSIARTGGLRPDETWDANRHHAEIVATLAAEHGITLVTFHAGFLPHEVNDPEFSRLLTRIDEVAGLFASRGIMLGLETGQETAETLLAMLDRLDRPNVAINFDPANMILYGKGDPVEAFRHVATRVCQIHIKDALPSETSGTWGVEVSAGTGAVDWTAFFAEVRRHTPTVDLVIEREAGHERELDIAAAVELVRTHLSA